MCNRLLKPNFAFQARAHAGDEAVLKKKKAILEEFIAVFESNDVVKSSHLSYRWSKRGSICVSILYAW